MITPPPQDVDEKQTNYHYKKKKEKKSYDISKEQNLKKNLPCLWLLSNRIRNQKKIKREALKIKSTWLK